jgi:hypothetical protein
MVIASLALQLGSGPAPPPTSPMPFGTSAGHPTSKPKLARVLVFGVLLAATILASSTAVADAKDGSNGSAFTPDGRRPPTEQ